MKDVVVVLIRREIFSSLSFAILIDKSQKAENELFNHYNLHRGEKKKHMTNELSV